MKQPNKTWAIATCILLVAKTFMMGMSFGAGLMNWNAQIPPLPLPTFLFALAFLLSSLFMSGRNMLVGHLSSLVLGIVTGWSAVSSLLVQQYTAWSTVALVTSVALMIAAGAAAIQRRSFDQSQAPATSQI
ncbi:hypothetical protein HD598_001306 [Neomicrococcus aestuarii]|uniref:Uncharacterized protein n=1 Tax=Neomicrococcus aestuarii TaxID=556325 RepID=A0A7W8TTG8_9MICC|nr:hypothetical protein [Neomicrococcus aestuarii]MBB5512619.1 hypothetical protein [Neomicrococcus aestuarii]